MGRRGEDEGKVKRKIDKSVKGSGERERENRDIQESTRR